MRRIYFVCLTLFLCIILGACTNHSTIAPTIDTNTDCTPINNSSSIPSDSSAPTSNTHTAYLFDAPTASYEDQSYLNLRQVDIPEKINGLLLDIIAMYNEDTLIVYLSSDTHEEEMQEVGLYHIFDDEYKKLFDVTPDLFAEVCLWTDSYIVYRKTNADNLCRLYIQEIDSAEIQLIYEYDVAYSMSSLCGRPSMLYNNAIFFDDTVSKDGNIVDSKILKYDLGTHSIELFQDNAQFPFLYRDIPYYILRRDTGNSYEFTIKAITSDQEIPLTERLHTLYPDNSALYSLENISTNHSTKTTTWGIVDIVTRQELLSTDITIGEVASNQYFVTWWNYLDELPVIYCVEQNTFVVIDQVRKATNTFVTYENAGLLISLTFDNSEYYYFSINK